MCTVALVTEPTWKSGNRGAGEQSAEGTHNGMLSCIRGQETLTGHRTGVPGGRCAERNRTDAVWLRLQEVLRVVKSRRQKVEGHGQGRGWGVVFKGCRVSDCGLKSALWMGGRWPPGAGRCVSGRHAAC